MNENELKEIYEIIKKLWAFIREYSQNMYKTNGFWDSEDDRVRILISESDHQPEHIRRFAESVFTAADILLRDVYYKNRR